jgi:hypothetical protein
LTTCKETIIIIGGVANLDSACSFNFEFVQNRTIFIIYVIYIIGLYYLIWRRFVTILQNELWKTKSMLG